MKKALIWIVLVLVLLAGAALAGGGPETGGEHDVSVLETNTVFPADTTLIINDNVMEGEHSIVCNGNLTITVEGEHFLVLDNGSGAAVRATKIELKDAAILWPEGASVGPYGSSEIIKDKNGNPAPYVVLGPRYGWKPLMSGTFSSDELPGTNILLLGDATVVINETGSTGRVYDPTRTKTLKIARGTGKGYLSIGNYQSQAIDIGKVEMESTLMISNPRSGKIQGGTVVYSDGEPVVNATFSPRGKYKIHTDGCFTLTNAWSLNCADEGDLVLVYPSAASVGTYMSDVITNDVTIAQGEDSGGDLTFSFTMPAGEVSLKVAFSKQIPYTFKMSGYTEIPVNAEKGLKGAMYQLINAYSSQTYVDGDIHCDLDKDGSTDIIRTLDGRFRIADTWSLGDQWTSEHLSGKKYSPLTFTFQPEEAPADPTPVPTAITVGKLKYKLNGSNAIVTGAKDKNAKKLTIPKTIKAYGKTYKVTEIGAGAFKSMKKLTAVTIGENVKTIGKQAFYKCAKLKTITIKTKKLTSSSVKSSAFKGIYKKATFKCPKGKAGAYKKILLKKGAPKTCRFK